MEFEIVCSADCNNDAGRLISALVNDPEGFRKRGVANDLLKCFFRGYPIEALKDLLRHSDSRVVRSAIWIASELPSEAAKIIDLAIGLREKW